MALIELEHVEKRYGDLVALSKVSLSLKEGRVGLLGPNGAGKSTLIKTLLGLSPYDHGTAKVFGYDVAREPFEARKRMGYMPEGDSVLPRLNALQYVELAGELCGLPRIEATARAHQVLHYVGLGEARYRVLTGFSTGMKQRARLAQALVGDPKLLLLDEPTSGLDPRGRDEMLQLIVDIPQRTGASVLLSTHILPDVEKTCDQVVVLAHGEVLYAGALAPLVATEAGIYEVRIKGDADEIRAFRSALELAQCVVTMNGATMEVRVPKQWGAGDILRRCVEEDAQVRHLAPLVQTLERAFLKTLADADAHAA